MVQPELNMAKRTPKTQQSPGSDVVVIKFGGNTLTDKHTKSFCAAIAKLIAQGIVPVIIHGGGPQIDTMLNKLNIIPRFVNGLRYTDAAVFNVVEMVLVGHVNKLLVSLLAQAGVSAVGICGKDGNTLRAEKLSKDDRGNPVDLGLVGQITQIDVKLIEQLLKHQYIPVMAPIAQAIDNEHGYNINADHIAVAIAKALSARHLVMMTNTAGLMDGNGKVIHDATPATIEHLIASNVIQGGMIPKTMAAIDSLSQVGEVHIINGDCADNLLAVLSGKKRGTTIKSTTHEMI